LVHQVAQPQVLDAAVDILADKFRSLPPRTVGISKRIIDQGYNMSLRESQDLEIDAQVEVVYGPDVQEALDSFLQQRRPSFIGE
jgi:enoyl-CoA hydratase/carnithine racemase